MGSSDNVVRGGLTSKHVDVEALLSVVDFHVDDLPLVSPSAVADGVERYDSGEAAFRLLHVGCDTSLTVPAAGVRLVLVTSGALEVTTPGGACEVRAGHAAYVPADAGELVVRGVGAAWVAEPGAERR